ncbi:MAG: zinc ribbon domain-containing protein [Candidatus Heimdallarchaeota archaeon]|nr:zinc ribbon domain-containing protein [Candidatus Heimdallarchaeota archaeon]
MKCTNCSKELLADWRACPECATIVSQGKFISCHRCHQLILDPNPKFCPYCQFKLVKKVKQDIPVLKFEEPERTSVIPNDDQLNIQLLRSSYKFDGAQILRIAGNSSISRYRHFSLFLLGMILSCTAIFIGSLFEGNTPLSQTARIFITTSFITPSVLYASAIGMKEAVRMSGITLRVESILNVVSSTVPVYLVVAIVSCLLGVYTRIFMGAGTGESEFALMIFYVLMLIVTLFMTVQLVILVKNTVGASGLMSILLILLSYWIAGITGGMYIGMLLNNLLDVIL